MRWYRDAATSETAWIRRAVQARTRGVRRRTHLSAPNSAPRRLFAGADVRTEHKNREPEPLDDNARKPATRLPATCEPKYGARDFMKQRHADHNVCISEARRTSCALQLPSVLTRRSQDARVFDSELSEESQWIHKPRGVLRQTSVQREGHCPDCVTDATFDDRRCSPIASIVSARVPAW